MPDSFFKSSTSCNTKRSNGEKREIFMNLESILKADQGGFVDFKAVDSSLCSGISVAQLARHHSFLWGKNGGEAR